MQCHRSWRRPSPVWFTVSWDSHNKGAPSAEPASRSCLSERTNRPPTVATASRRSRLRVDQGPLLARHGRAADSAVHTTFPAAGRTSDRLQDCSCRDPGQDFQCTRDRWSTNARDQGPERWFGQVDQARPFARVRPSSLQSLLPPYRQVSRTSEVACPKNRCVREATKNRIRSRTQAD